MPWSSAGTACGILALTPDAVMREPLLSPAPTRSTARGRPAAGDRWARDDQQFEQQLDPVFRQQHARQVPGELGLVVLDESLRHGSRVAEIDLRAGRAGGAEGEAAELQARRCRPCAPL